MISACVNWRAGGGAGVGLFLDFSSWLVTCGVGWEGVGINSYVKHFLTLVV